MFQMLGVFAEFERAMISERVKAGLSMAKRKGKKLGRSIIAEETESKIRELRSSTEPPMGILKIAEQLRLGTGTVQRVVREMNT